MTADVEVLPCPFCGGGAEAETYVVEAQVVCLSCRAKIVRQHGARDDNGLPEAIAAWNTRAHAAAAKDAEIEALRAEASTAHEAVLYHIAEHAKTRARAERLAEALREVLDNALRYRLDECDHCVTEARAALHQTAAQEGE